MELHSKLALPELSESLWKGRFLIEGVLQQASLTRSMSYFGATHPGWTVSFAKEKLICL